MSYRGRHFDLVSAWNARRLTHALWRRHFAVIRNTPRPLSGDLTTLPEIIQSYTRPLEKLAESLPLGDVRADIQEFGLLAMLAQDTGAELPVLSMNAGASAVPLLPPQGFWDSTLEGEYFSADQLTSNFQEFIHEASELKGHHLRSLNYVQKTFFRGLQRFLAARIAGVRWARKLPSQRYEEYRLAEVGVAELAFAGEGGGGAPPGQQTGADSGAGLYQRWTVHTRGSGYSLFWGGTHAINTKPHYLNGVTTPLDVYLPTGTLFLAADAGPGGDRVWDDVIITVPSRHQVYYTKKF